MCVCVCSQNYTDTLQYGQQSICLPSVQYCSAWPKPGTPPNFQGCNIFILMYYYAIVVQPQNSNFLNVSVIYNVMHLKDFEIVEDVQENGSPELEVVQRIGSP